MVRKPFNARRHVKLQGADSRPASEGLDPSARKERFQEFCGTMNIPNEDTVIAMWRIHLFLIGVALAATGCGRGGTEAPASSGPGLEPGITAKLGRTQGIPLYWVDDVGPIQNPYARGSARLALSDSFVVRGWAVDQQAKALASGVELVIDKKTYRIQYLLDRPDVADGQKNPAYRASGFLANFPASVLGRGAHVISLRVLANDGKSYSETPDLPVTIE